ncbi:MAG: ferrous iron transport protein B [Pseudomonadota bacterium]
MADSARIPVQSISVRRQPAARVAVLGNPNSGKSTLFNRLTGLRQKTGNYPGVTVERHVGRFDHAGDSLELIDLPGMFALSAHSLEERVAADIALGRIENEAAPDAILAVVDATHLYQSLALVQQLMELGKPVLLALTMTDAADRAGTLIDIERLSERLGGVPICPVVATTGQGLNRLRDALVDLPGQAPPAAPDVWPELGDAANRLAAELDGTFNRIEIERALIDVDSTFALDVAERLGADGNAKLAAAREAVFGDVPPLAAEAQRRYDWARDVLRDVTQSQPMLASWTNGLARLVNQPWAGTALLFAVMAVVFQAVFAWATPLMDFIDGTTGSLVEATNAWLGDGAFASFVADGIIAGVGSVIIFLPQILILFLFIIVLEDSGFLARSAYLMDRAMRSVGLSGTSIIPMISSFACAVPGIMATRVIPNRRDRIATILAAPFMTCSARLPVYALLISAFVPATKVGVMNLQGLVLFGLYLAGIVGGLATALLLKKTALRGPKPSFALLIPEFRRPNLQTVGLQLLSRARVFLRRAGTVIFAVAVIVWALGYFPRSETIRTNLARDIAAAEQTLAGAALEAEVATLSNVAAARQLEQSYLGRAGKSVQPLFAPLGWDWRVSAAVIASFPAREVVVAVLGTTFALGAEADEDTLSTRLANATHSDGRTLFTLPMVAGLLLFYAFCLQCAATVATIRRETNSWRWPIIAWVYMTAVGYVSALAVYQLGS